MIGLADEGGGVTDEYAYSPFGEVAESGGDSSNSLKYTGREDDSTGLYYYRARYYDPGLGRFISSDPIGLLGGINSHSYVDNKPTKRIDPLGLESWDRALTYSYVRNQFKKDVKHLKTEVINTPNKIASSLNTDEGRFLSTIILLPATPLVVEAAPIVRATQVTWNNRKAIACALGLCAHDPATGKWSPDDSIVRKLQAYERVNRQAQQCPSGAGSTR